jgi:hypothetical protein
MGGPSYHRTLLSICSPTPHRPTITGRPTQSRPLPNLAWPTYRRPRARFAVTASLRSLSPRRAGAAKSRLTFRTGGDGRRTAGTVRRGCVKAGDSSASCVPPASIPRPHWRPPLPSIIGKLQSKLLPPTRETSLHCTVDYQKTAVPDRPVVCFAPIDTSVFPTAANRRLQQFIPVQTRDLKMNRC